jgi:hypothetical protein
VHGHGGRDQEARPRRPSLRPRGAGLGIVLVVSEQIVVLNNLAAYKDERVWELLKARGGDEVRIDEGVDIEDVYLSSMIVATCIMAIRGGTLRNVLLEIVHSSNDR